MNNFQDRSNKRIAKANEIASHDTKNFDELTKLFKERRYYAFDIMREYRKSPDSRFNGKLLIFCNLVDHRCVDFS
jgi:hypothetical protein